MVLASNSTSTSTSTSTSRSWASAHTDEGAASRRRPLDPRALSWNSSSCAGHNGRVSCTEVIAAKSRRAAVPFVRVPTRAKRRAVFHLSSGGIFECGLDILKVNTTRILFLNFKKPRPCSKCHRQVGGETTSLPLARTRSREARRADILRLSRW